MHTHQHHTVAKIHIDKCFSLNNQRELTFPWSLMPRFLKRVPAKCLDLLASRVIVRGLPNTVVAVKVWFHDS